MTDLVARLRAVNPVRTCDAPSVEDVWRRLEHEDQLFSRDAPRLGRADLTGPQVSIRLISWLRHVGLGLAFAVPVLVAALAIILLGHNQDLRPGPLPRSAHPRPTRIPATSNDAALARGVHPPAPNASMALPILGSPRTRSLESFRGKVVVLNVFASWCRPCRNEAATLEQAQTRIIGEGATVLGVTYKDNAAASEGFVRAAHITYPVLRDINGRFLRAFDVHAVPQTFVIDRRGRIVAVRAGEISRGWLTQALVRVLPGGSTGRLSPIGLPTKSPPAASELAAMAKAYPVLGRRQQPIDIPPYGVLDPYALSQGALIANTRRAVVTSSGESLYIVPGHQSMCVMSSDNVTQGCQPFPYTATTPADIGATICSPNLPSTELEVAGLMPPDASDIKAHYSNGSSQPVKAANGMIAIYAPFQGPLPESITWMSPKGPERTSTAVPPDAASSKCAS